VAREPKKPSMPKVRPTVEHDLIRELARLLDETGLTEIEFEHDGVRVRVARHASVIIPSGRTPIAELPTAVAVAPSLAPFDPAKHPGVVASPMVGTAYVAAEPGAKPFVDVGSRVAEGDTLLIIEAMKTMNQVPAPRAGIVTQILFEDGQPVEFGEPLMIIE
jgi:acetyl-CoA carboxylase biotin carboxyl carrier protein